MNTYSNFEERDINDQIKSYISNTVPYRGVLSDVDIASALEKGQVIIHPYNPEKQLGNCSYDVTLGRNYYSSVQTWSEKSSDDRVINPHSSKTIEAHWGPARVALNSGPEGIADWGVLPNTEYIRLAPRELILGHTEEFIGGTSVVGMVKSRSTYGRCGISCCKCAGYVDQGYFNRITLEIENHNDVPAILTVGQSVSQIVFLSSNDSSRSYSSRGSYQTSDDIEVLKKTWTPSMMLPVAKRL